MAKMRLNSFTCLIAAILSLAATAEGDDDGFWSEVEVYVRDNTEADFTHGYCPSCSQEMMDEMENMRAV